MSNIYIQEPPTNGKVLMRTTAGDIDIELWSKETPKACRNFVQLCLEGYYDGTKFHRVVPEFIVQGGDPTGTGTGGESIYGRTFKVLHSPFDDIEPRETKKGKKEKDKEEGKKSQSKATKNFSLLSFGEEAEEDEEMVNQVSQSLKGKSKSSHDLLKDDPRLSSVPVVDKAEKASGDESQDDEGEKASELVRAKLQKGADKARVPEDGEERGKKSSRSEELRKEVRQLKKELKALKQREDGSKPAVEEVKEEVKKPTSEAVAEYLEERKKYEERRKGKKKKGSGREEQTMDLLNRFKSKLSSAINDAPEVEDDEEELAEDDDKGWLGHVLQCDEQTHKVKDANMQDEDTFEIYDPRNPVNKRRREESKKIMKEKKAKR
ncbi:spliceosome-associated protein CWC27 homolog isoform X3 [Dunckerocampus dactyliophorus]|uniref:spliceosome-associated protein CWC27 homolog isoform X3 n=1 Tax=Dunckerocampus dactyliophorus TaxID=161453 RepID=UPI0024049320|nr:spliceosome-associated protein CWC27 homolog isoform X3 [Dunckerocampus dactyliophorus]